MLLLKDCLARNLEKREVKKYHRVFEHISYANGVLLMNSKIIIPESSKKKVLKLAHEGHLGMVKTKQRLRSKVWWPQMSADVEEFIRSCHGCQVVAPAQPPTPVEMTSIPKASWLVLGCDLCGPFPTGESLLVCVDYYSRFPEVDVIHKTTSAVITKKLRKMICRYGVPHMIITDNGPQFQKYTDFKKLMKEFGIRHRKVAPYHPEANGEVERFNRSLKKCIQTAITDNQDWRVVLENFLMNYRNAPHATTGKTPAELMFGRPVKDKIPVFDVEDDNIRNEEVMRHDEKKKKKN